MKINRAVTLFKMMSNPIRLKILKQLSKGGELCVGSLEEAVGSSQSSTSQHLAHLKKSGVLKCEKRGKNVCYGIADQDIMNLINEFEFED